MRLPLALLLSLGLATAALAADDHDQDDPHLSEAHGLTVLHPWTNAGSGGTALIFAEIENTGDAPIAITGAESHEADAADLVGFVLENGEGRWQPIPRVEVAPGRDIHFEPGVLAIRLTGLEAARAEGGELEIHLLTDRGEIALHVEVEAEDATGHSHAGHAH